MPPPSYGYFLNIHNHYNLSQAPWARLCSKQVSSPLGTLGTGQGPQYFYDPRKYLILISLKIRRTNEYNNNEYKIKYKNKK